MKSQVTKKFEFEAAHQLKGAEYGKCQNLHGHTYKLEVTLEGEILPNGMVINFTDLKEIVKVNIIDKFDHKYLNNFFKVPTAENMADYIMETLTNNFKSFTGIEVVEIVLYETSNSKVTIKK